MCPEITQGDPLTDREAMLILAQSPPEPFRQVIPSAADNVRWQRWHDRYILACAHVAAIA